MASPRKRKHQPSCWDQVARLVGRAGDVGRDGCEVASRAASGAAAHITKTSKRATRNVTRKSRNAARTRKGAARRAGAGTTRAGQKAASWRPTARQAMAVCGLAIVGVGSWAGANFCDLDIGLLGIGYHRNPLFHSVLAPFLAWRGFEALRTKLPANVARALTLLVGGFTAGVGLHLGLDAFRDTGGTMRGPIMMALKLALLTVGLGPGWVNQGFLILNVALSLLLLARLTWREWQRRQAGQAGSPSGRCDELASGRIVGHTRAPRRCEGETMSAKFEIRSPKAGEFRWVLVSQGRTLATSPGYRRKGSAEKAIDSFRMAAIAAPVADQSPTRSKSAPGKVARVAGRAVGKAVVNSRRALETAEKTVAKAPAAARSTAKRPARTVRDATKRAAAAKPSAPRKRGSRSR
jgi:uncharacterized protein YegP (UPF0339 family)